MYYLFRRIFELPQWTLTGNASVKFTEALTEIQHSTKSIVPVHF